MDKEQLKTVDYKMIGARIKAFRAAKGLSQEKLGEKVHSSTAMITAIERGVKSPSIETLLFIAKELDVTADDILEDAYEFSQKSLLGELNGILKECSPDEKKILLRMLHFMKGLLSEYDI